VSVAAARAEPARPRTRFTARAAILAVVVVGLLFYLVVPLKSYMAQRSHLRRVENQEQVLEQQNAALRAQVAELHDPAYLERIARQCLGMVRPGEIAFVVVPKGGKATPPSC
jgi:cell division protein FtsL